MEARASIRENTVHVPLYMYMYLPFIIVMCIMCTLHKLHVDVESEIDSQTRKRKQMEVSIDKLKVIWTCHNVITLLITLCVCSHLKGSTLML